MGLSTITWDAEIVTTETKDGGVLPFEGPQEDTRLGADFAPRTGMIIREFMVCVDLDAFFPLHDDNRQKNRSVS